MSWRALAAFLAFVGAFALAAPAQAHVRSESHSVWEISGKRVDVVFSVAELEVQRLSKDGKPTTNEVMEAYLAERVFPLSGETRCTLVPPIVAPAAAPGFRKYDLTYECPSADNIAIHSDAFFDLAREHINFAQIQNAAGDFAEELLSADRRETTVAGDEGSQLQTASFLDFVHMGVMHIFTGVDHMAFLLGLVLISRRLRDLVFVVTGFTIGHSATLALAVTGVLRPHAEYIDALVALTIALVGAENIAVQTHKPGVVAVALGGLLLLMSAMKLAGVGELPVLLLFGAALFSACYLMISGHLRDAGRLRIFITLMFGLIHGFGFAANLLEMQLPTSRLAELLFGFNLGVEIGQLSLVVGVSLLAIGLSRIKLTLPRPIVVDAAAALLVGLGLYWFIGRSFSFA
jgi:hypothetical protein